MLSLRSHRRGASAVGVRPRRSQSALGAIAAVVFAGLVAMQPLACTGPLCPEGWVETNEEAVCKPPPGYEEAVAQRIGTGIYGYALGCYHVSDGDDACTCEVDSLAVGESFTIVELGETPELTRALTVNVRSDGTFEVELPPGGWYRLTTYRDGGGFESSEFTLEQGEKRLFVVTIIMSC